MGLYFRKSIEILLSFSLIKKTAVRGIYCLHPLVHCWSRDSISNEERQATSSFALTLLASSSPSTSQAEIMHIVTLLSHTVTCSRARGTSRRQVQVVQTRKRVL